VATEIIGMPQRLAAYFAVSTRGAAADPDDRVVRPGAQLARELQRRVKRAAGGGVDVRGVQRRTDHLGHPLAEPRADHHRDVATGRDPPVGQDSAEVGDRAAADVDVQRRLDAAG
jgi:hypothetical protein